VPPEQFGAAGSPALLVSGCWPRAGVTIRASRRPLPSACPHALSGWARARRNSWAGSCRDGCPFDRLVESLPDGRRSTGRPAARAVWPDRHRQGHPV